MATMVQKYSGKPSPEKSNFAQTCNLLSQYLKERGNLGDIIHRNLQTTGLEAGRETLNLLPSMENSKENKSIDLLPRLDGDLRKTCSSDLLNNQMTIFYAGKVLVFDDFPADKAKEIMAFAAAACGGGKGSSSNAKASAFTSSSPVEQQLNYLDLPIARKASLHRFFEKRRDRVIAKAPYQIKNRSPKTTTVEERNSWLELEAQSSKQLELKL